MGQIGGERGGLERGQSKEVRTWKMNEVRKGIKKVREEKEKALKKYRM